MNLIILTIQVEALIMAIVIQAEIIIVVAPLIVEEGIEVLTAIKNISK